MLHTRAEHIFMYLLERGRQKMLIEDLAVLFEELNKKYAAKDIAKHFERERKFIYYMKNGCTFHLDYAFIAGLKYFGYELKLVKVDKGDK